MYLVEFGHWVLLLLFKQKDVNTSFITEVKFGWENCNVKVKAKYTKPTLYFPKTSLVKPYLKKTHSKQPD